MDHGEIIYIPTNDAPRQLFPGLESCLLAEDLDDLLMYKLSKVAAEGNIWCDSITLSLYNYNFG